MPPPSWSRSPEARASDPDRYTRVWIRWLALRFALPLEHVATVLALDLAAVDACINRTTRSGPVPGIPTRPPTRTDDRRRRRLTGQSATKVRRLTELGYPPSAIARILDVPSRAVKDLLRRLVPSRRAALVRPRSRAEQKRIRPPRPRCEPPPAPPAIPVDEAWRYQDGPSPTDPPPATIAPAAVELHQVEVEAPPPAREPWVGSTSPFGGHVKLTEAQALEVCAKRAAGWSVYELADAYEVTRNTIYRVLRLTTYPPPPLPC